MTDQVITETKGTIFESAAKVEDQKTTSTDQAEVKSDPVDVNKLFADKLATITNEDGVQKYNTLDQQLQGHLNAERHIKTLETEMQDLRNKIKGQETMQEALQNLSARQEPETTKSEGINAEQLKGMTLETLKQYEQSKIQDTNKKEVSDQLIAKFGDQDKAKLAYKAKAEELGVDIDTLVDLAAKSPKAVLSYFGTTQDNSFNTTTGSMNTSAIEAPAKKEVDYSARYLTSTSPSLGKWKEAGEGLYNN